MTAAPLDAAALARQITAISGPGPTLHCGAGDGALVATLLSRGSDAHGIVDSAALAEAAAPRWPGRIRHRQLVDLGAGSFETVVVTDVPAGSDDDAVGRLLGELRRVSARNLFLAVGDASGARDRAFWESRAFATGFRKHAAYYRLNPYAALNDDRAPLLIPLEKVPDAAFARFPLAELHRNRQLHMDMLREVGRRGDAHCIRYHEAARHVRPGDAVLDLACGYGYGSQILYQNSQARSVLGVDLEAAAIDYAQANYAATDAVRFEVGNAQALDTLADDSIDFIASFETIEHLPDPDAYLDELRRVLRPGGRIMVCAPNDWSDETGEDPNPHHLHVYTWQRLRDELSARFLLERGFVQTAGGAMKCHHAPRAFAEVTLAPLQQEAEWILLLAMKDPIGAAAVPYRETRWRLPADPGFHVSAFARDYENPWLVKAMVTVGMRAGTDPLLASLQDRAFAAAASDSVDRGAALCGQVYAALAEPSLETGRYATLQSAITDYAALPAGNPHRLRWQISLLFAGGELARKRGDNARAQQLYEDCASRDPDDYSPLLGNRTLDALFRLATMCVARGDLEGARTPLLRSVATAHRLCSGSWLNVCGDLAQPLPFGLAELAQLLDKASRAAYALTALESAAQRPAVFAQEARGWFERVLEFKDDDIAALARGNEQMRSEILQLDARVKDLGAEVVRQDARAQQLAAEVRRHAAPPPPRVGLLRRWWRAFMRTQG